MYQGNSYATKFANAVEGMFDEFDVDVYLSGHVHSCACAPPPPSLSLPLSLLLSLSPSLSPTVPFPRLLQVRDAAHP